MAGLSGENEQTMCRLTAILASVMLLLASFVGPLFHLHEANQHELDVKGPHAHSAVVHTHLAVHSAWHGKNGQPTIDATHEGNEGNYVSLCVFEHKTSVLMPFLVERGFIAETSTESSVFSPAPAPQAHDPPTTDSASARAPPA